MSGGNAGVVLVQLPSPVRMRAVRDGSPSRSGRRAPMTAEHQRNTAKIAMNAESRPLHACVPAAPGRANAATPTVANADSPTAVARRNIKAIAELESRSEAQRSTLDRVSQLVSTFASSAKFVVLHFIWFSVWIVVNVIAEHPVDRFPFTFLTFLVSLEAIFLTSFVLISQSHLEQHSRRRAELDLQISLLAEEEMTKMLVSINAIAEHLGIDVVSRDPELQAMAAKTDVSELADALESETNVPSAKR